MSLPPDSVEPPEHASLVADLEVWRVNGVRQLRGLDLVALRQAAIAAGLAATAAEAAEPAVLTELVRGAIATKAGSVTGRCALVLLGLDPDTFDLAPNLLREEAADIYGVSLARFRRDPQREVLMTVAESILEQCLAHRARLARLAMEQRHPADTRLAVHWLERFEAYFRIWTPVYAYGADLSAYRWTLIDPERPWDESADSAREESEPYTQERQAAGFANFGLFHLAGIVSATEYFKARFGGLWLLSTPQAEVEARDALFAVTAVTDMNERDQSWLHTTFEVTNGEMHPFLSRLREDPLGRATCDEWRTWLGTCACSWNSKDHSTDIEYFPTARFHRDIAPECNVHQAIEAANRYCAIIEHEWLRVADWYHIDPEARPVNPNPLNRKA